MKIEPFKIRVNETQSAIVQKTLFKLGCTWLGTHTDVRNVKHPHLYIRENGYITYSCANQDAFFSSETVQELTFQQFHRKYIEKDWSPEPLEEAVFSNTTDFQFYDKGVFIGMDEKLYVFRTKDGKYLSCGFCSTIEPVNILTKSQICAKFEITDYKFEDR